jgi:hypothetical protein
MLAFGIMLGVGAGIAGTHYVFPRKITGIVATPLPKSVCETTKKDIFSEPLPLGQNGIATPSAAAAAKESDLVRALAKGKGLDAEERVSSSHTGAMPSRAKR